MADSEQRERGLATFEKVMGFKRPPVEGNLFVDVTTDHLFGEVWARPGLPVRDRRLITLTVLACLGNESTLRSHLGAAMRSGDLSDEEIDEMLLHIAHYAGWPPAAISFQIVQQLRLERDKASADG